MENIYDIFQDPQTKMTGGCDMSTASSKKEKTSCGWQMLKKCVKIFACKHHDANDTSRHPCAFETKPRNTGNADRAGRASSALALADSVVTDAVLVDDFVVDLGLLILVDGFVVDVDSVLDVVLVDVLVVDLVLDTVHDVVLVDAAVDVVQLEVGVLALAKWKAFRPIFPLV